MVEISEVMEEEQPQAPATNGSSANNNAADARSQERLDDAAEIEAALEHITRPSARLHLENLITKLRKEGKALQRVAASRSASGDSGMDVETSPTPATVSPPAPPKRTPATTPILPSTQYQSFPTYYFDAGKYNSPTVTVYVPLDGIGTHADMRVHQAQEVARA